GRLGWHFACSRSAVRIAFFLCTFAALAQNKWSPSRQEDFLRTARIIERHATTQGSTHSTKVKLSDGRHTHNAHVQQIDIYQPLWKGKDGSEERDFKDSWKFNVAAYRLARLLGLTQMVPVCVERVVDGKLSAVTWWIDDIWMDEKKRVAENIVPPDPEAWRRQMDTIRVFDQLIYNMDRSRENLLITSEWKAWMIDHTRAFRKHPSLRN